MVQTIVFELGTFTHLVFRGGGDFLTFLSHYHKNLPGGIPQGPSLWYPNNTGTVLVVFGFQKDGPSSIQSHTDGPCGIRIPQKQSLWYSDTCCWSCIGRKKPTSKIMIDFSIFFKCVVTDEGAFKFSNYLCGFSY